MSCVGVLRLRLSSLAQRRGATRTRDHEIVTDAQVCKQLKHINTIYHFVRELCRANRTGITFVGTIDIEASRLTKAMDHTVFKRFVSNLSLTRHSLKG